MTTMACDYDIKLTEDTGTPALEDLQKRLDIEKVCETVGNECTMMVKHNFNELPANKRGWPSTGFWGKCSAGTDWDRYVDGVIIWSDNADAPGALRQQLYGGEIHMKNKMLTIPAMEQFYGHRAGEFTDLRFALLGGHPALIVPKPGAYQVNFSSGTSSRVRGTGPRAHQLLKEGYRYSKLRGAKSGPTRGYEKAGGARDTMVAYWLRESVDQEPHPEVMPSYQEFADRAADSIVAMLEGGA